MRFTAVHAAILAGALATTAMVLGLSRPRRTSPLHGPVLLISQPSPSTSSAVAVAPPSAGTGAKDAHEERAMALAGASMSAADRRRVLDTMHDVRARLASRLSPLGDDLGDGEPLDELRGSLRPHLPAVTAARAFERGHWESAELSVRVAASCDDGGRRTAGETCVSLWDREDEPSDLARRARFLAWSVAGAAVIDLGTRARAEECAATLRQRTSLESSTLGLVLLDDDLAMRPTPDRPEIQEAAHDLAKAVEAEREGPTADVTELEAVATATLAEPTATWLDMPATAVVIVPRLSAIADAKGFREEIEVAAGAPIKWVHRP